jgi:S1-C subfamily serine protease
LVGSATGLTTAVIAAKPNEKVTLTILRHGSSKQVSVTLGTQPAAVSNNCS